MSEAISNWDELVVKYHLTCHRDILKTNGLKSIYLELLPVVRLYGSGLTRALKSLGDGRAIINVGVLRWDREVACIGERVK